MGPQSFVALQSICITAGFSDLSHPKNVGTEDLNIILHANLCSFSADALNKQYLLR